MTCCVNGPSSTKLPSAALQSSSVIISISPIIGSSSVLATGFPNATFFVPSGARNGGRALPNGFSRLGTCIFCGVPMNIGFGSLSSIGTNFSCFLVSCPNPKVKNMSTTKQLAIIAILLFFI